MSDQDMFKIIFERLNSVIKMMSSIPSQSDPVLIRDLNAVIRLFKTMSEAIYVLNQTVIGDHSLADIKVMVQDVSNEMGSASSELNLHIKGNPKDDRSQELMAAVHLVDRAAKQMDEMATKISCEADPEKVKLLNHEAVERINTLTRTSLAMFDQTSIGSAVTQLIDPDNKGDVKIEYGANSKVTNLFKK